MLVCACIMYLSPCTRVYMHACEYTLLTYTLMQTHSDFMFCLTFFHSLITKLKAHIFIFILNILLLL